MGGGLLYVSIEQTRHDILHGVTNGVTLGISAQSQVLLHLTQVIDPIAKPPEAAVHHVDVEGILHIQESCPAVVQHCAGNTHSTKFLLILRDPLDVSGKIFNGYLNIQRVKAAARKVLGLLTSGSPACFNFFFWANS